MRTITLEEHFISPGFLSGPGKEFTERLRNAAEYFNLVYYIPARMAESKARSRASSGSTEARSITVLGIVVVFRPRTSQMSAADNL